jgi:putative ABC transport system permease protein
VNTIDIEAPGSLGGSSVPETYQAVTPGYFEAAGIPVVGGRTFDADDVSGGTPVAIINAECARRYFGADDPIGKRIRFGRSADTRRWRLIVGVVRNTIVQPMDPEIDPRIYVPYEQDPGRLLTLTIRTHIASGVFSSAIVSAIREVDPLVAVETPISAGERLHTALWPVRFFNGFAGGLAVLGLLVAGAGIYGLTQYLTMGRSRELAVRVALGAAPRDIARLIVGQTTLPLLTGSVIGLAISVAISNVLKHLLPGVPGIDPLALVVAAAALTSIGAAALALPALKAVRMQPARALKDE